MTLEEYKRWYVLDEGHWYTSKVKQYTPSAINEFARGLKIMHDIFSPIPEKSVFAKYKEFKPKAAESLFNEPAIDFIRINRVSKLFCSLRFLVNDLIDTSHMAQTNPKKFAMWADLQKDFITGMNYDLFIKKYSSALLQNDVEVYYRNFKSWLGKYGFYGETKSSRGYFTDAGLEFAKSSASIDVSNAFFFNQIKKYQFWNPNIDNKYNDFKVKPHFLLLEVLLMAPKNYITKDEYVLFVTKIKSHAAAEVKSAVDLILEYRNLSNDAKSAYIDNIITLDKQLYKKRTRTNFERLKDSAGKEIPAYTFGDLMYLGDGQNSNLILLSDVHDAQESLNRFNSSAQFVEFVEPLDWINYLGSLDELTVEEIIDIYLKQGKSLDNIKTALSHLKGDDIEEVIKDRLYEKEVEDYYEHKLYEINPNLEIVSEPNYGRQFPTHIGPIDILCVDKVKKQYVVLEFKRGQVSDETVGQILRYMGWVYINMSDGDTPVLGIIIGSEFSEKMHYSLTGIQRRKDDEHISLFNHPFSDEARPII